MLESHFFFICKGKLKRTMLKYYFRKNKAIFDALGLGSFVRQAYVESQQIGEKLKFIFTKRPASSDVIFLAGSGRSGTTWITNVLCALPGVQQIFEPIFPLWNESVRQITGWDKRDPYLRQKYLRPTADQPAWRSLWRRILEGRFRNYWTDYERTSYFPERFLVKEVRANLMLGFIYHWFQPRIIYILRHPCAVIHSRLAAPVPWHADVRDLIVQTELVEDYLLPWVKDIENETDLVGAHAVWWAVENRVALDQLKPIPHYLIYYEDLVLRPTEVLLPLLAWLGYECVPDRVAAMLPQPSRMSNTQLTYKDTEDRLTRWQRSLSIDAQQRVLDWSRRFGLDMYTEQHFPLEKISNNDS